ncbi:acetyltransferase [Tenacibaculum mesophilum]|uniref:PglD-related sugar-binding protein n=1 Tax=Tenacibaculum mesophilum TaxID=104268 RepID=UPI00248FE51F|nr:acetyltransferase [Tenacibaculum mesophilum]
MRKIAIVGAGGLGREVLGILESINKGERYWDIIGFFDDSSHGELINGLPIIGNMDSINQINEELAIIIGIGNPNVKEKIISIIKKASINFPAILHPTVEVYSENIVSLGKGIVIGANSVFTTNISIGDFVYINTSSIISHDTKIGEYSMIMPTVSISAGATIGKKVYIGNGTIID